MPYDDHIIILGAGGHAKVVVATAQEMGYILDAIYDDDPEKNGSAVLGVPVLGSFDLIRTGEVKKAVIAVGDNQARKIIAEKYQDCCQWITLVHPYSYLHPSVKLGQGTVVFAGACIQPDTSIGQHCIINTGATIDHDSTINDYVHIGPGVNLAGNVNVGKGTLLGAGGTVIPGKSIGGWSIIGAGAAIIHDIADHVIVAGVPASVKKNLV